MDKDIEVTSVRMDKKVACAVTACAHLIGLTQSEALTQAAIAWLKKNHQQCIDELADLGDE